MKDKREASFYIDGLDIFKFDDTKTNTGPVVREGRIAIRGMQPLIAIS